MNFEEFIKPELLILIPVLNVIGLILKDSNFKNKLIPLTLGCTAILLAGVYVFATESVQDAQEVATALFTAVTQGILIAGASVYFNQLVKQAKKEE